MVTTNARNRVWHSKDTFEAAFNNCLSFVDAATIPIPSMSGEESEIPIFDIYSPSLDRMKLKGKITNTLEGTWASKGLPTDFIASTKERMFTLGLTGEVWDKKATRMYGVCTPLRDLRILQCALGQRTMGVGERPTTC